MNEILINIISVIVTAIILPLISIVGTQLIKLINSKLKNYELNKEISMANAIVTNAVRSIYQTYVDDLKRQETFDSEAQDTALIKAKELVNNQMNKRIKRFIENNYGDFDNWLTVQIEATIYFLKQTRGHL